MLPGAAGGGGRRFLLTGVVSRYQVEPSYLGTTYWLCLVMQGVSQMRDRCDQGCGMT